MRSEATVEAISRLIYKHPFYAVFMIDVLTLVEGDEVPRAGTDGRRLYINPKWFATLSLEERVFVLIHEVKHVILGHIERNSLYMDRGIGPDLRAYSPDKMNQAMDYIINDWIVRSGNTHMPQGGLLNPQFGMNDVADEVYCKLNDPDNPPPPPKGNPRQGQGQGQAQGDGDPDDGNWDTHMRRAEDAPSKAEVQRAAKGAQAAARAQGKMPAGMDRLIDELCEPQVPWAEQIRTAITTTAGRDESTYARPNRRRLAVPPHIYMPGMSGHKAGCIVVYDDSSGSISTKETTMYRSELAGIYDELNPEELWIGSCDSKATDPVLVESSQDIIDYKSVGGGGTDMPAIFRKLAEHRIHPDCLVILTDGYTNFDEPPGYEVIWVMTTDVVAPYGRTLRINAN
jgi:predicted metal-dependent peptidase